jgi:hypothetical protein
MIPFLLHHANRGCKLPEFYAIKNKLLAYAEVVGYDVQYIEGKRCHTCQGSGTYHGWDFYDTCNRCAGSGWYKQPMYVFLSRKKLGRYVFHTPMHRSYGVQNPYHLPEAMKTNIIEGYISHDYSRYSYLAILTLFLLYDRAAAKKYFREMGFGWRCRWWWPMNYLYVAAHFVRHGSDAYPCRNFKSWWRSVEVSYTEGISHDQYNPDDQLPF